MPVEIKGVDVTIKKIQQVASKNLLRKMLFETGSDIRIIIEKRNEKGMGLNGKFKEYSTTPYYRPADARPKAKGGRRKHKKTGRALKSIFYEGGYKQFAALTKKHTIVNLFASGQMLEAMQVKLNSDFEAIVHFTNSEQSSKAYYVNQLRPFFGLTKAEEKKVIDNFNKRLDKYLK